jgi:hypothetical protein
VDALGVPLGLVDELGFIGAFELEPAITNQA